MRRHIAKGILPMVFSMGLLFTCLMWVSPALSATIELGTIDPTFELTFEKTNGDFASDAIIGQSFKTIVEKESNGRIQVKVLPNGQLGGYREMFEMTRKGSLNMVSCNSYILAAWVPEVEVITLPYLFKDINVLMRIMEGPRGKDLNDLILKKTGVRVLGWTSTGYYDFMTVKKQLRAPSDLKGMKIRTPESPYMMKMVELTGAAPTPIPYGEIYTSLKQGVVDGLITGICFVHATGADEILKYIVPADATPGINMLGINEKYYQSLPAADQYLVQAAAKQANSVYLGMMLWGEGLWVGSLKDRGIDVHSPTPSESEQWIQTLRKPMIDWERQKIGSEWVNKYLKAAEEVEKEIYGKQ